MIYFTDQIDRVFALRVMPIKKSASHYKSNTIPLAQTWFIDTTKTRAAKALGLSKRICNLVQPLPRKATACSPNCQIVSRHCHSILYSAPLLKRLERQTELRKYVYTRNREMAMRLVPKDKFSTFWFSDRRRSPCALIDLYFKTVQFITVTINIIG